MTHTFSSDVIDIKRLNMKRDYMKKLSHLAQNDKEELIWFYYGGMEEKLIVVDYNVDLQDPLLLYRTFPFVKDELNRICPHCKVALLAFQESRTRYGQEVFCEQCDCVLDELYDCKCEKCMQEADEVTQAIKQAFHGVELGTGIGLYEAHGLDGYADDEECRILRKKDELFNWEDIPIARLSECYSSLSFFDPAGMRFHLPAYMIAEIRSPYGSNAHTTFSLTNPVERGAESQRNHSIQYFSLLNEKQRAAVVLFLKLCISRLQYEDEVPLMVKAINEFWSK
jgi:hypothetical protein